MFGVVVATTGARSAVRKSNPTKVRKRHILANEISEWIVGNVKTDRKFTVERRNVGAIFDAENKTGALELERAVLQFDPSNDQDSHRHNQIPAAVGFFCEGAHLS